MLIFDKNQKQRLCEDSLFCIARKYLFFVNISIYILFIIYLNVLNCTIF